MDANKQFIIYICFLTLIFIVGLVRFRHSDTPLRIMTLLMGTTICSEFTGHYTAIHYKNNMPVYHLYAPVLLFLIAMFYNYSLPFFRKKRIGYWVGIAGILLALLDIRFLEPLDTLNTNFMLLTGVCIIAMALYSFYYLYTDSTVTDLKTNPLFWISLAFLFYWCSTFVGWALLKVLIMVKKKEELTVVYDGLWLINLLTYLAIGSVFMLKQKNQPARD